ncbi:MAG: ComF family protein [Candidatus Caldatribacterium sp.]|nr:ComF family protein [Candidatus Caldatribacterium sp.]
MNPLFHLFLPEHCVACGAYVPFPSLFPLCKECQGRISFLRERFCVRCGRVVPHGGVLLCHMCRRVTYHFTYARAVSAYVSPIREAILAFKYQGVVSLAAFLGALLVAYCEEFPFLKEVDFVLPVPLHPAREWERGFSQALLLANVVGKAFRLPVLARGVSRVKPTLPQAGLKTKERWKNVEQAFRVTAQSAFAGKRVLVVDDVLTSRATAESLSRVLLEAGCSCVFVLAVASGR